MLTLDNSSHIFWTEISSNGIAVSITIIFSKKSANVRFANLLLLSDNLIFILITPSEYLCTDVHLLIIYQPCG